MKAILVVDDSPSIRLMAAQTIRSAGYHVVEAGTGDEALRIAGKSRFDLIVIDEVMPCMDGFTLVRALRRRDHYTMTPMVLMTSEPIDEAGLLGRGGSGNYWLVKPFERDEIVRAVARALIEVRS
jgi:two-component system chemotaxis response regulator CheY